jgi:hypothetical protein
MKGLKVAAPPPRLLLLPLLLPLLPLLAPPATAQTSASYRLEEQVFNAGGHPEGGAVMSSASYWVSLDSIGEGIVGPGMSSASYGMDGSFGGAYPPPGEVLGLRFTDAETLVWDPERSVGAYNLYRDRLSALTGLGYGNCEQRDLAGETATVPDLPPATDGFFYLVTAENRLGEEGTKGQDTWGSERPNSGPCP